MNKRNAISSMGVGIIFVIVIGIVMIISAPMMANKGKDNHNTVNTNISQNTNMEDEEDNLSRSERYAKEHGFSSDSQSLSQTVQPSISNQDFEDFKTQTRDDLRRLEERLEERMNMKFEAIDKAVVSKSDVSDKYVCAIVQYLDGNGQPVQLTPMTEDRIKKFVFECSYMK